MNLVRFEVSVPLLSEFLHLPDGARIVAASAGLGEREVTFWATGPDLPEAETLASATHCIPSYITIYGYGPDGRLDVARFEDWNLRESY